MSDLFAAGDRVDITIPGAVVVSHGVTQLQFTIPGQAGCTYAVGIRDERAREVLEVVAAVPRPRAGELYTVVGSPEVRLVAFNNLIDDRAQVDLYDPIDNAWYRPADAVAKFGPLHLSVPMPEPTPEVHLTPEEASHVA